MMDRCEAPNPRSRCSHAEITQDLRAWSRSSRELQSAVVKQMLDSFSLHRKQECVVDHDLQISCARQLNQLFRLCGSARNGFSTNTCLPFSARAGKLKVRPKRE